jgi:sporulation protein YlmC with PRC-barrel domain
VSAIQESVDVGVPVRTAYDQWTQFEQFPRFMEGVEEVRQLDETHLHWVARIDGREVEWDAEITEREPGRRVAWRSISGARNDGVVEFEPLGEGATRVNVTIEHEGEALAAAAGTAGAIGRRVRGDLERFKEMLESRGSATGAWRGDVAGGVVVGREVVGRDPGDEDESEGLIGPEGYPASTRLPSLRTLKGMDVCTPEGDKVGTVVDVFLDSRAEHVRYLAVRTGWLLGGRHVVPVDDVTYVADLQERYVVVPYTAEHLRGAPSLGDDEEVTPERERAIYDYYERVGYWEEAREAVRARQTPPAPTQRIAEAEVADAIARGDDPTSVRVKRWGV